MKHMTYIKVMTVIWLAYLCSMYFEMQDYMLRYSNIGVKLDEHTVKHNTLMSLVVMMACFVCLLLQGIALGFLRLEEPNYRFLWK
jgi:uncharacterized membrane protein